MKTRLLLVDDEPSIRFAIRDFLGDTSFDVEEADSVRSARARFARFRPDIVICDYSMPDGNALELLPDWKASDPGVGVLILTAFGTIDLAVNAIKLGADQFLTKPVELPALLVLVERIIDGQRDRRKRLAAASRERKPRIDPFLGSSPAIRRLRSEVDRIGSGERPILIRGETGTGKGVLARWIHDHGPRAAEALVDLNCAGLNHEFLESELFGHERGAFTGAVQAKQGLFEVAHRGTLFLDEIGDVDLAVQPKLLKAVEEQRFRRMGDVRDRSVNVALIAATHQDLRELVQRGLFRSDLYFRISTLILDLPPLRSRVEDIGLLAHELLERFAIERGQGPDEFMPEAVRALETYSWPGNVRELRNVIERASLLSDGRCIRPEDLRFELSVPGGAAIENATLQTRRTGAERESILSALRMHLGNVEAAANHLCVPRSTLYYKIKKLGIPLSGS